MITPAQRKKIEAEAIQIFELDNLYLLKKYPFYGHILSKTTRIVDYRVPIAAVSLRNTDMFYHINPNTYVTYPRTTRLFIMVHELKHLLQLHHPRGKGKMHELYNVATDVAINQDIENEICEIGEGFLLPNMFHLPEGLNADQYYDILLERNEKLELPEGFAGTLFGDTLSNGDCPKCEGSRKGDGGEGECDCCNGTGKNPGGDSPFERLHPTWDESSYSEEVSKELVRGIVMDAISKSRGDIPGNIQSTVTDLLTSKINWKQQLRNFVAKALHTTTSPTWAREKRSGIPDIMGRKKHRILNIVVGVDTSGSVLDAQLAQFWAEIKKMHKSGANVTIIECDRVIQRVYQFKESIKPTFQGRGGTRFTPVFDFILSKGDDKYGKLKVQPDAVIFLTDGDGVAPRQKFHIPTCWVVTKNGCQPYDESRQPINWGRTLKLDA